MPQLGILLHVLVHDGSHLRVWPSPYAFDSPAKHHLRNTFNGARVFLLGCLASTPSAYPSLDDPGDVERPACFWQLQPIVSRYRQGRTVAENYRHKQYCEESTATHAGPPGSYRSDFDSHPRSPSRY